MNFSCLALLLMSALTIGSPKPKPTCECGRANAGSTRIVGGVDANIQEFPWRCGLHYPTTSRCGATIISSSWLLTAAHCTERIFTLEDVYLTCGHQNFSSKVFTRKIEKIIQHENYTDETYENDISLIKVSDIFPWSETIKPICLPWKGQGKDCEKKSTIVTATGWGLLSTFNITSNKLQKVKLKCLSTSECENTKWSEQIYPDMLCATNKGKDTCMGDSGGSIDYYEPKSGRSFALGITSFGRKCADEDFPGVYTKISSYLEWIKNHTDAESCM